MLNYLTEQQVLAIHSDQIKRYGGSDGIIDRKRIDAALARARIDYYPDIIAKASALWESLSQNHPFVDGNKRTAFASMHLFLKVNGVQITSDQQSTIRFVLGLYNKNQFKREALEDWLRKNTREG